MAELNNKDRLGYNFEMRTLRDLKRERLSQYLVYANPKNFNAWKRKIAHGVDSVLKIGIETLLIRILLL